MQALDREQLRALLEQTRLDLKLLREFTAALCDRASVLSLDTVALGGR